MTRNLTRYLLLAFGFSWLVALFGALLGIDVSSGKPYVIMAALAMVGPGIAAVVMQRVVNKAPWPELGLRITDTRWRMLVATGLVGMAIVPLCLLVASVFGAWFGFAGFGEVAVSHDRMLQAIRELSSAAGRDPELASKAMAGMELPGAVWLFLIQASALLAALTINIPFMLGEELGWRGYLFHATAHFRGLHRVLFTGVTWGFWHAPLILLGHNYPDHRVGGVFLMVVFCTLLAFLFDWSRSRGGSIWPPTILHGLINGSAGGMLLFAWGGDPLLASPVGLAGMLAIALLVAVVLACDGKYRRGLVMRQGVVA